MAVAARARRVRRSPPERDRLAGGADLAQLSYATEEIRAIAASLPGAAELHLGATAQKRFLGQGLRGVPLLHFSTHAIADTRDPERSRVLLAPPAPRAPAYSLSPRETCAPVHTGLPHAQH